MNTKTVLLICMAFLYSKTFSQKYMHGYFASKYEAVSDNEEKSINKSIYIIFNDTYCKLFIQNKGSQSFGIFNYKTTIQKDGIHTSFLNLETNTLKEGWYMFEVIENKNGVRFNVYQPNFSYYSGKANKYSEDGKITSYLSVDYDKYIAWMHEQDSLVIVKENQRVAKLQQQHTDDSIYLAGRDSTRNVAIEKKLNEGDNFNHSDIKWMADIVSKKVNIDAYCYGDLRVIIDKEGNVTDAKASNIFQGVQYIDLIKNSIVGQKTKPFISSNGHAYPSYAMVYINIEPAKKEKKSSFFKKLIK